MQLTKSNFMSCQWVSLKDTFESLYLPNTLMVIQFPSKFFLLQTMLHKYPHVGLIVHTV